MEDGRDSPLDRVTILGVIPMITFILIVIMVIIMVIAVTMVITW